LGATAERLRARRDVLPAGRRYADLAAAPHLSAGVLDVLRRRRAERASSRPVGRRPPVPASDLGEVEVALREGADRDGVRSVDTVLRRLAAALAHAGRPPLRLLAVRVSAAAVEVRFSSPRGDAPGSVAVDRHSSVWTLPRDWAPVGTPGALALAPTPAPAPAPALVGLGGDGVGRVLLDLEACQSPVTVRGEESRVHNLLAAMAIEVATSPWGEDAELTLVGFDELSPLVGGHVRLAATVGEAWSQMAPRLEAGRAAMAANPGCTAPELRLRGDSDLATAVRPQVLISAVPLSPGERASIMPWFLQAPARAPLAVVAAGKQSALGPPAHPSGANWSFRLDHRGVLSSDSFGHPVGAQAVAPSTVSRLTDLVRQAGEPLVPASARGAPTPSRVVRPDDVRVVLHLLGSPRATGDVGPGSPAAVEVAAFVALRGGCDVDELVAAVWPAGVADREVHDTIRRTRWWLGLDTEGWPRLDLRGGILSLSAEVQTDWDLLLAHDSGTATLHHEAIRALLRGAPVSSDSTGRYAWLAREPVTHVISAVVVDVCLHAATRAVAAGDTAAATELALGGLLTDPTARCLWPLLDQTGAVDGRLEEAVSAT
jgi:hypothetical protein